MKKHSKYTEEEIRVMAEFESYMDAAIRNISRNVTRKAYRTEMGQESLEQMGEEDRDQYLSGRDAYAIEEEIHIEVKGQRFSLCSDMLKHLLDGLSRREQEAVILHDAFCFSYSEIGELLGITSDRAKSYRFHGMKKIRRKLEADGREFSDWI